MAPGEVYAFGPFELDIKARRLTKQGEILPLTSRQFDLLHFLVAHAGRVLSKDQLIAAAWQDVNVTDNTLEQAISSLRRVLALPSGQPFIETQARRGYRFAADVAKLDRRETDEGLEALLAPHRAWIEGRAALETLERDEIVRARQVFRDVLVAASRQAPAHVGLANARALEFEMTRSDPAPDVGALEEALEHAREACRLDPQYGEAWATLGFVLDRTGRHADALAASRRAVSLEPDNWRHHFRLGYASWGEERLREARRTLTLLPGFPLAHWLAASVHVARQAFDAAESDVHAGLEGQTNGTLVRFSSVALHWLHGLLQMARGDLDAARASFRSELENEGSRHLYSRECCANTWYAIGALEWRCGRREDAATAFGEALRRVPLHPLARLGAAAARGERLVVPASQSQDAVTVERAIGQAIAMRLSGGETSDAASVVDRALSLAAPGSAGWLLPLEPLLHVSAEPGVWAAALARLRHRAA